MGRIARRGPKAIPIIDKERTEKFKFLTVGSPVEVTSDEDGFKGAWFEAKIITCFQNLKCLVQYQTLLSDTHPDQLLKETFDVPFIRPLPPPPTADQIYEPGDVVDAFHHDGWWKGVVSKVVVRKYRRKFRRRYTVVFENPSEQFDFYGYLLRFHHVWFHGRWVRHPQHKVLQNRTQCKAGEEEAHVEQQQQQAHEEPKEQEEESTREEEESAHEEQEEQEEESGREEEESAHVSLKGSSTSYNHGEEQSSVKKSRGNPFEQSTSLSITSTSKKQKIAAAEIEETLSNYSNKFRKENSSNPLSPDECRATSILMNSTGPVTDSGVTKGSTFDTSGNLQLAGSKGKNFVLPNSTQCEEQSARVSFKGSNSAENLGEEQSSATKSKKNPVEHPIPFCAIPTSKKQKMSAPEIEETLPNSNKFGTDNRANILSPDECHATSMLMNSTEQVADSATTKCSTFDTNGDRISESSEKRETELNTQVTSQQVPAAAGKDEANEDPAEVITEGNVETFNQSPVVKGQAEFEPVRNKDPPFIKSSFLWEQIDALEVFRILPQKPHFSFLSDCHEETREGSAIGHMLSFSSLVEKVSKLQIEDPTSLYDSYLDALAILEEIGFDVKAVVDRIKELLSLKTRQEQLSNQSKMYQSRVTECDEKKAKLEEEISAIDKMMCELEQKRALKVSEMVKEDSSKDFLQFQVSSTKDAMFDVEQKFKVKSEAPW